MAMNVTSASSDKIRLGFWSPVHGNWIIPKAPDTIETSFETTKKPTLLAEELGFATVLLAEHTCNPFDPERDQQEECRKVVMIRTYGYAVGHIGTHGGTATGTVGPSPQQVAYQFYACQDNRITTFLLQFHSMLEEMERFGEQVIPLLKDC